MTTQVSDQAAGSTARLAPRGAPELSVEELRRAGAAQVADGSARLRQLGILVSLPGFLRLGLSNGLSQSFGQRIQSIAVAWLVLDITGSAFAVGVINGLPAVAIILFSLVGGFAADSRDPLKVLLVSRAGLAAVASVMALIVASGVVQPAYLLVYVVIVVSIAAVDMPVSRKLTHSVVGTERLLSASAAQSVIVNLVNIAAPITIGLLIGLGGPSASFWLLAAGYVVAVGLLHNMSKTMPWEPAKAKDSAIADVRAGLAYIASTPLVAGLIGLAFLVPVAGIYFAMVPVYARETLGLNAAGLGFLVASFSVGSLASSLFLASNGAIHRRGRWLTFLGVGFGLGVIAFALSRDIVVASGISLLMGVMAGFWQNMLMAMVQTAASAPFRGRVVAFATMGYQLIGLGWLLGGVMETVLGLEGTLVVSGTVFSAFSLVVFALTKEFREMD